MDKIIFGKSFAREGDEYLEAIRKILNDPIKQSSEEVAESFGRYNFVKLNEKDLAKNFEAKRLGEEIFAPKTETFAANLLKTSKDEQLRLLRQLDDLLPAEDKVIEDLLDAAASEAIESPIQLLGLPSRIAAGALGGRKAIAGFGQFAQEPSTRAIGKGLGRGIVTGATAIAGEE